MTIPISRLKEALKPFYEGKDPAHRFDHIERMLNFCNEVGEYLGADMELLRMATLLHGLKKGNEDKLRKILGDKFEEALKLARNASRAPTTLEEKILWDANVFDALGAIGLVRAFTKGGYEGQTIKETVRILRENMERPLLTPVGRTKAEPRLEYMRAFLMRLDGELGEA